MSRSVQQDYETTRERQARAQENVRAAIGFICPSTIHLKPVDGTVLGTFDSSRYNNRPPVRVAYCARCAQTGEWLGVFTPDEPTTPAPAKSCPTRLMDGRNEIRCWLTAGHEGDCK